MQEPQFTRLLKYERNSLIEQEHCGVILHIKDKNVRKIGNDNSYKFFQRSCMKPLQFAAAIDAQIDEYYHFSSEEIAIACASHCGTLEHQRLVKSILLKLGLDESNLQCGKLPPLDEMEKKRLILEGKSESEIHNNCSGKHAAMLAICFKNDWDIKNYTDYSHPLNQSVIKTVTSLCEVEQDDYVLSKDGCSLPTIATTLEELGRGFLNLFLSEKYHKIKEAFAQHPYLIGGNGRLDSEIINASKGKLISKVGAGGLIVVVNLEKKESIVVKIADSSMNARALVTIKALQQLDWLKEKEITDSKLNKQFKTEIKTTFDEIIGNVKFEFNLS